MDSSIVINEPHCVVRVADWNQDSDALQSIRRSVFIEEQNISKNLEWDGLDPQCTHFIAEILDGTPVGTARLLLDGHIGRIAVLKPWRRQGIGRTLLNTALNEARKLGYPCALLNAQVYAIPFYEKAGFTTDGEEFTEAGILHKRMRICLGTKDYIRRE